MSLEKDIEQLGKAVSDIWSLLTEARVYEAKAITEKLLHIIQIHKEDVGERLIPPSENFAHVYHVAGYTASMSVRNAEAFVALQYFREMKCLACDLQNATLYVIALTYEGDTHRRLGNLPKALSCLQKAYKHSPQGDRAAHGNCAQLLGRSYFRTGDFSNFAKMMEEAEQIARTIDQVANSLHGQYCLGTVYIDYARSYNQLGQTQKALDYLQQAQEVMPPSPHWKTLVLATRGIILVKNGEMQKGMPDVLEAVKLGYEHGNQRLLDRFYALERYLNEKAGEIHAARLNLSDALDKSLDF